MTIITKILEFFKPKDKEVEKLIEEGEVDLPKYEERKHIPHKSKAVVRVKAQGKKPTAKKPKLKVVRKKKK
jgi:hypothetical protein